ncbi:MAG: hypothetical protein ACREIA_20085 [Opitutaceae bacterium]
MKVDALSSPTGPSGWSYTLAGGNSGRANADSRASEVANRIHLALSQRGLYEAPNRADADYVIAFDYGERAPQAKVTTVNQPVMVQPDPFGNISTPGMPSIGVGGYPGTPYSGRQSMGPQIVMVPTTQVTRTSEKYLFISARENPAHQARTGRPPAEIWRVEAILDDESVDIHKSIPALVDAVVEYMGYNTNGPQDVVVQLGP